MSEKNLSWVIGGDSGIGQACANLLTLAPDKERFVVPDGKFEMDVRVPSQVGQRCREIIALMEDYDNLEVVYSAGFNELEWIGQLTETAIQDVMGTNCLGFMRVLDGLARTGQRDIRIVAISSDAASRPLRTSMAYCASKAALDMCIRVAAREMAQFGWRINGVAPGMTANTGMTRYIDRKVPEIRGWKASEALEYELSQAVVKRRAEPAEIAHVVFDMLTGPDYLNGAIVPVNGGR